MTDDGYVVRRSEAAIPLGGDVAGTPWADAAVAEIDAFPWGADRRQATTVRALHDGEAVALQFHATDACIAAEETALNGEVWTDSCVEFFFEPRPGSGRYFNLEANCCGTLHLGYGDGREGRRLVPPAIAAECRVETSVPGPTKAPAPDDESWWLAASLPFDALARFADDGSDDAIAPGRRWRGNFQRCSWLPEPELAAWQPIETSEPDFHRPEHFGDVHLE